ncbi:MAG: hypothetical protein LBG94_02090 [Treponema sp.]|jgi:hypothetical protein|nr:hypothetical protein [Treponema sp.]
MDDLERTEKAMKIRVAINVLEIDINNKKELIASLKEKLVSLGQKPEEILDFNILKGILP